jgi:hypothetical protein
MAQGEGAQLPPNEDLLRATLDLAQTQLLGQIADETSLDGRMMGVLAFNGALLAADVAAKNLLGPVWWAPLVPVGIATIIGAVSVASKQPDFGPLSLTYYTNYRTYTSGQARETLLSTLAAAFEDNAKRIKGKKSRLRWALVILAGGLIASALIIRLDKPPKTDVCARTAIHQSSSACHSNSQRRPKSPRQHVQMNGSGELIKLAEAIEGGRHGQLVEIADAIEGSK